MTEFQLITDVGTAVATAASDADDIQILVNGEIPETYSGLRTDIAKECAGGVVALSPEYNTYAVTPTAGDTISFDAGNIPGCRFKLLLDCTAGAVSFSFADNFKWTGATPALTDKGLYGLDVVYVSVNGISAFLGTYLGVISKSIDPNKGVVVYRDGVISEDECGEEFNNLLIYNSENEDDGSGVAPINMVVDINPGSIINGYLELGTDDPATLTVNVKGGTVGIIPLSENSNKVTLNVSGGNVDTIRAGSEYEVFDLNITGGTIGLVSYNLYPPDATTAITVSGGIVSQLRASLSVEINGGFIGECCIMSDAGDTGELVMTGGTIATLYAAGYATHVISGGEVQYITDYYVDSASSPAILQLSDCTIGTITHNFNSVGVGDGFGLVPEIGDNVVIDRLDYIDFDKYATSEMAITLAVGANSTLGLSLATQRAITAGMLTINADPTATIINLGN